MKTKLILEIGSNWKSLDDFKRTSEFAKENGCLMKGQLWETSKFVRKENKNYEVYKRYEVPRQWVEALASPHTFWSAFDPDSLLYLKTVVLPEYYKVASLDSNQKWMIESCGVTNKMTFVSCGVYGLESVRQVVRWYDNPGKLTLMHCVVDYPTKDAQLGYLKDRIAGTRTIDWGFSYNGTNIEVPLASVAIGVSAIEVHFKLDHIKNTPDAKHSMTKDQIKALIRGIRIVEDNCGNSDRPLPCEKVHIKLGGRKKNGKR